MAPTIKVSWAKERRIALERIISGIIPDVMPDIPFRKHNGARPLHLSPEVGLAESSRLFWVSTGPMAGLGALRTGNSPMNGDTYIRVTSSARIDIRYTSTRSYDSEVLTRFIDMTSADEEKIAHAITPSAAAAIWGNVAPYSWAIENALILDDPEAEKLPKPYLIMSLFISFMHDLGRNNNY